MACMVLTGPAHAQGKMGHMQGIHKGGMMESPVMSCMMTGLSGDEKKIAMAHMAKMTPAEKAVMMKRGSLCMKDSHKAEMGMKPSEELMRKHMVSGLTMAERKTMMGMYMRLTRQEKPVLTKMVVNCCTYGMKHAK